MTIKKLRPFLLTENLQETIEFYINVLGFKCGLQTETWAALHLDKAEIMFTTPDENFDKPNITGSMYFDIDNIDEVWEDIKGKSKVHYAIEDKEWQKRQFAIYDNNGYILEFGQDIT